MLDWLPPEWFAAITSSTVTAVAAFVAGTYYKAKVEKGIQHNLDSRLEEVRSAFRKEEQGLRSELDAKSEQIAALRSGALQGMNARYAAIDQRRLDAIENLWRSTIKLSQYKLAAKMTAPIKMEVALDIAAQQDDEGRKTREFAETIWKASSFENLPKISIEDPPEIERPFLPPFAWALFSAYRQALSHLVAQLAAMRSGVGSKLLADPKPMLDLVKTALPHQSDFVDKFGTGGLTHLIDELEEKLLLELQRSLWNPDSDKANLEQAVKIVRAADKLSEPLAAKLDPPASVARAD